MSKNETLDQQVAQLMSGTEYGDLDLKQAMADELRARLVQAQKEGRPLRVYCGFDPRTSDLHLGHTVPMRKMRQFQEYGHEVTMVIGRFTSLIGDASDQNSVRAQISFKEATRNAESYAEQAFRILDPEKTHIAYNDTWLAELRFADLIQLTQNFTIQQFLSRDNFRKRWDAGDPIFLHEMFYAIMQGYDALHLKADIQIGGTDQLFNIITAARKLMEAEGLLPNIGIILGILPGTDGEVKMSKSLGNHIPLRSSPEDMYGKVMSVPDKAMPAYYRLVTRWSPAEINRIEAELKTGRLHPRDAKMRLAREVISIYHGDEYVQGAEEAFRRVFQQGDLPEDMPLLTLDAPRLLVDLIVEEGLAQSKSEARRLIKQKGIKLDDEVVAEIDLLLEPGPERVLRVGKRRFLRIHSP